MEIKLFYQNKGIVRTPLTPMGKGLPIHLDTFTSGLFALSAHMHQG